jgi:hypothetical protein
MADDGPTLPGRAEDNNERILARPHDDFARFPAEEVDEVAAPGAGPRGTLDDGPALPILVMGVGVLIAFSTFLFSNGWPLAIGLVVLIAGAVWAGVSDPLAGSRGSTGPTSPED